MRQGQRHPRTSEHLSLNIRKFVVAANGLEDLVALGTVTAHAARFLEAAVAAGLNIIVAGGTQAGKTALRTHKLGCRQPTKGFPVEHGHRHSTTPRGHLRANFTGPGRETTRR